MWVASLFLVAVMASGTQLRFGSGQRHKWQNRRTGLLARQLVGRVEVRGSISQGQGRRRSKIALERAWARAATLWQNSRLNRRAYHMIQTLY